MRYIGKHRETRVQPVQEFMHPLAVVALFKLLTHFVSLVQGQHVAREKLVRTCDQAGVGSDGHDGWSQRGRNWRRHENLSTQCVRHLNAWCRRWMDQARVPGGTCEHVKSDKPA